MAITRRAFGTVKNGQNAAPAQNKPTQDVHNILKRPLAGEKSPGIPSKRKNIQAHDKENQIVKIEAIQKKITEIKITEEYANVSLSSTSPSSSSSSSSSSSRRTRSSTSQQVRAVKSKPNKKASSDWKKIYNTPEDLPDGVIDYDRTQLSVEDSESVYANDIFKYLQEKEKMMMTAKYMHKQPKVTEKMRAILIDWLVEVQQNFELFHETLYLSVKYVDHYLMKKTITSSKLQLLGLTAIFIASKFEERYYPSVEDFIYMCDDAYTKDEFLQMEIDILSTLTFDVNFPLSYSFLRRYSRCASTSIETLTLARYILESSLVSYSFVDEFDSKISAAALLLANRMQNITPAWTLTLTYYSGYQEEELGSLVTRLNKHIADIATLSQKKANRISKGDSAAKDQNFLGENIFTKYSDQVFHKVAKIRHLPI